jgi:hypothetical protein
MTCAASGPQGEAHPFLERAWLEVWDVAKRRHVPCKDCCVDFVCLTSWPIIEIDDTRCGLELNAGGEANKRPNAKRKWLQGSCIRNSTADNLEPVIETVYREAKDKRNW